MAVQQPGKRRSVKSESKSTKTGSKKNPSNRARSNASAAEKRKQPKKHRWLHVVVAALVVVVAIVLAAFSWDRWFRFDDAADIQGSWQAAGQAAVVEIDGKQMHLTDEVAYDYTLDTGAKTIEFTFGTLAGSGTYRFSEDRGTLTIVEGASPNIVRDFFLMFGFDIGAGEDAGKPTTVFVKAAGGANLGSPEPTDDRAGDSEAPADPDETQGGQPVDDSASPVDSAPAPGDEQGAGQEPGGDSDAASGGEAGMLSDPINDRGVA